MPGSGPGGGIVLCDVWYVFTCSKQKKWHEVSRERSTSICIVLQQCIVQLLHNIIHPVIEITSLRFVDASRSLTSQEVCSPLHHLAPLYLTRLESVWGSLRPA